MDKMNEKMENFNRILESRNKSQMNTLELKDTIFEIIFLDGFNNMLDTTEIRISEMITRKYQN